MSVLVGDDDVAGTPLQNKALVFTPRSSVAGYNLRPEEVLKRRLSAGKLKFACASTPRRKSTRPKGFLSAKKSDTDRVANVLGMGEPVELNSCEMDVESGHKDGEQVTLEGSCSTGERNLEKLNSGNAMHSYILNYQDMPLDLLSPVKRKRVSNNIDVPSSEKENSCLVQPSVTAELQIDADVGQKDLNSTPSQSFDFSSVKQNISDQIDTFSTPCLGTPALNTTFIKDETLEADQLEMKTEPNIEDGLSVIRQDPSDSVIKKNRRSTQRKHDKENKSRLRSNPEPCNVKKVEFSIKDIISSTSHPEDIRLYAEIQQEFFPLQVSKTKMDLLLSSEDNSFTATTTPMKTPNVSKIPRLAPSTSKKSILKSSAPPEGGNHRGSSSKLKKMWAAPRPFQLPRSSSTRSIERNYRRHTLSSAAKVKPSHLLPAASITTVAFSEANSSQLSKNKTRAYTSLAKHVNYHN